MLPLDFIFVDKTCKSQCKIFLSVTFIDHRSKRLVPLCLFVFLVNDFTCCARVIGIALQDPGLYVISDLCLLSAAARV